MNKISHSYIFPAFGIGFLIWLMATIAFRVAGQYFFITESKSILIILYLIVIPLLSIISAIIFRKYKLSGLDIIFAGVLLVLPGMLLDTFVIQFFELTLPNMPANRASTFGSWLMWSYSIVLITSIAMGLKRKNPKV